MSDRLPLAVVSRIRGTFRGFVFTLDCLHEPNYLGFHGFRPF